MYIDMNDDMRLDYEYFNPNPRGKKTGDCVKRAIVVCTGMDYKELELDMNRCKKDKKHAYNYCKNFIPYLENVLKLNTLHCNVPAGTKRWHVNTIKNVIKDYSHLSFILQVSKHLIGIKNNTIYDTQDDRFRDKGIYKIWVSRNATKKELEELQNKLSKGETI